MTPQCLGADGNPLCSMYLLWRREMLNHLKSMPETCKVWATLALQYGARRGLAHRKYSAPVWNKLVGTTQDSKFHFCSGHITPSSLLAPVVYYPELQHWCTGSKANLELLAVLVGHRENEGLASALLAGEKKPTTCQNSSEIPSGKFLKYCLIHAAVFIIVSVASWIIWVDCFHRYPAVWQFHCTFEDATFLRRIKIIE